MGLTASGLVIPRLADYRANLRARVAAILGQGYATGPESPLGQTIDAFSIELASAAQLDQEVYDAFNLDTATGLSLDNLASWHGMTREPATHSTVTLTLGGTPGIVVTAGKRVGIPQGATFVTLADATIGGGGTITVAARAEKTGPVEASATDIDEILTSVSGWATVTNAAAAVVGQDLESDSDLRLRIQLGRAIVGCNNDSSLRAKLEALNDVIAATVISNRTGSVDGFGIPAHAFRPVIWPSTADAEAIAALVWASMLQGIGSDGAQSATVEDSKGVVQTVQWSWASEQVLYLDAIITKTSAYPADGDTLVSDALEAAYAGLSVGDDVVLLDGICAVKAAVPGILTFVLEAGIGSAPGPGDIVNLSIDRTQIATLDALNITVAAT